MAARSLVKAMVTGKAMVMAQELAPRDSNRI
jgi:hypothetical protein